VSFPSLCPVKGLISQDRISHSEKVMLFFIQNHYSSDDALRGGGISTAHF